jgi:hypothetical protein
VPTEEADPGSVGERRSDQIFAEPAQGKIVELQPVGDMPLAIRPAEVKQGIVGAEGQQAAAAEHPGCLGHPPVGVGKRHRAEIAEHDVEACIAEGQDLRVCLQEWNLVLAGRHQAARIVKLTSGDVQPDRPRALACKMDRPMRGPASEYVFAAHVAKHP